MLCCIYHYFLLPWIFINIPCCHGYMYFVLPHVCLHLNILYNIMLYRNKDQLVQKILHTTDNECCHGYSCYGYGVDGKYVATQQQIWFSSNHVKKHFIYIQKNLQIMFTETKTTMVFFCRRWYFQIIIYRVCTVYFTRFGIYTRSEKVKGETE